MKIGIVGFGYVGQALFHAVAPKIDCAIYDIAHKDLNDIKVLEGAEAIFIALPTPNDTNGRQDPSALHDFINAYDQAFIEREGKQPLFIIKSTILHENIKPHLDARRVVISPEFLSQNSAKEDCLNQKTIIIGGRADLAREAEKVYRQCTRIDCSFEFMSAEEAINFKYIRNIYGAYKVLFWNWVHEQTGNARRYSD